MKAILGHPENNGQPDELKTVRCEYPSGLIESEFTVVRRKKSRRRFNLSERNTSFKNTEKATHAKFDVSGLPVKVKPKDSVPTRMFKIQAPAEVDKKSQVLRNENKFTPVKHNKARNSH